MLAIEARGLCKAYRGRNVVDGLDMHVTRGDIYGFVGRNGAGKSTTMKMICGMIRPTAGEVLLFDRPSIDASGEAPESSTSTGAVRIGALVENPGLYPNMTALENMRCKAMALGLVDSVAEIEQLLCIVGLDAAGKKPTKRYSLGMKQRLGLALAMLGSPDVLLLDEPMNGLDPEGVREMRNLIIRLNEQRGITVVISSHVLDQLGRMATRYGVINAGRRRDPGLRRLPRRAHGRPRTHHRAVVRSASAHRLHGHAGRRAASAKRPGRRDARPRKRGHVPRCAGHAGVRAASAHARSGRLLPRAHGRGWDQCLSISVWICTGWSKARCCG
ncbi:ATP-binding cassette domain-containing protein [uncultured Eggerthella sp.]|uniref:ATP-binding cassette domain-containing protein n=1 Tax=uncultured Eggerthella sp. TaxID=293422 RepID=UPI002586106B|nr:ATP-binding cassette domain-containing protein [uncultured Eggerthella sp.]